MLSNTSLPGNSLFGRYLQRLYQQRFFALLLFLLQLWAAGDYYLDQGRLPYSGELIYQTLSLLTWSALPTLIVALAPYRWLRGLLQGITIFVYGYLLLFESFLVFSYSSVYTDSIALNILSTNPGEATAFLENLNYKVFLLPLFALIVLLSIYFWSARRWGKSVGSPVIRLVFFGALVVTLPISVFFVQPAQRTIASYLYMAPVERIYRGTTNCMKDAEELAKYSSEARLIDVGTIEHTRDMKGINVIIVLGESMRRDYMHCYGYPLPNTPHQDSLAKTGDLVLFTDAVSSAAWTTSSISESMTFYSREGKEKEWYKYPTLPLMLSKAGYYTYWVSNQEKQGSGVQMIPTIAATADSTRFVRSRTYGDWNISLDSDILPLLLDRTTIPQRSDRSEFCEVIHLMGSHSPFTERYIHEKAAFSTKDLPKNLPNGMPTPTDDKRRGVICDYVNSIHYNDQIISQIIQRYSTTPTILVYLSDHGQAVFENPQRPDYCEHEVSRPGVTIPLMVYVLACASSGASRDICRDRRC